MSSGQPAYFEHHLLRDRIQIRHWTTTEERVLRELYPSDGPEAVCAALQGRTLSAVYTRARMLGLAAPSPQRAGRPRRASYRFTEAIDAEIRRVYQTNTGRGEINSLCKRLMIPRGTVSRRAQILGLTVPRFREPDWTDAEIDLLKKHAWKTPVVIQRNLKTAGFRRSATAIVVKRKRLHLTSEDPNAYSARSLATLMGIDDKTVSRWIEKEGLKATRPGESRMARPGANAYRITGDDLRAWMRNHASLVDLRKVDRFWFLELVLGAPRTT